MSGQGLQSFSMLHHRITGENSTIVKDANMYSEARKEYFAKRYAEKSKNPEYLKLMADRARKQRAKNPGYTKKMNAKRRSDNPEKERARCRAWFAKNPDKRVAYQQNREAKKRALTGVVSVDIRTKLIRLQRSKCACCKENLIDGKIHLDHIMPITKDGLHDDSNLQLLCQTCNNQKYNKDPIEFMQSRGFLI